MAAPVARSFLSKQLHEGGMTMRSLGGLLQREIPAIRSTLPSGLSELFWPGTAAAPTVSPVVAQVVQEERSFGWLGVLGIAALGRARLWFFTPPPHPRPPPFAPFLTVASG